jgi:hypothetical protein
MSNSPLTQAEIDSLLCELSKNIDKSELESFEKNLAEVCERVPGFRKMPECEGLLSQALYAFGRNTNPRKTTVDGQVEIKSPVNPDFRTPRKMAMMMIRAGLSLPKMAAGPFEAIMRNGSYDLALWLYEPITEFKKTESGEATISRIFGELLDAGELTFYQQKISELLSQSE